MIVNRIIRKVKKEIYFRTLKTIELPFFSSVDTETFFEGYNKVAGNTCISKSYFGFGSYIGPAGIVKKTKIGKYCSIGPNFRIVDGNHPTSTYVSTYPAFFRGQEFCGLKFSKEKLFPEYTYTDNTNKWLCEIGNDVWIGDSVSIINGVKIGDGAILATGAVVVKDVPPYAIVGGVPARVLKFRFDKNQIEALLKIKWWDWSIDEITEKANLFSNIDEFIKEVRKTNDI